MITLLLHRLRLVPFLCGGHRQLALENLALHQQLAVYKRSVTRPKLRTTDRLFWVGLARVWAGWRHSLVIVTPDTVLRWQRRRFREHWTRLSGWPTARSVQACRLHLSDSPQRPWTLEEDLRTHNLPDHKIAAMGSGDTVRCIRAVRRCP